MEKVRAEVRVSWLSGRGLMVEEVEGDCRVAAEVVVWIDGL